MEIKAQKEEGIVDKLKGKSVTIKFGADYFIPGYYGGFKYGTQEFVLNGWDRRKLAANGIVKKRGRNTPYAVTFEHDWQGGPYSSIEYGGSGTNRLIVIDLGDKLGIIAKYGLLWPALVKKPNYGRVYNEESHRDDVYGTFDGQTIRRASYEEIEAMESIVYGPRKMRKETVELYKHYKKEISEAAVQKNINTSETDEAKNLLSQLLDLNRDKGKGEEK